MLSELQGGLLKCEHAMKDATLIVELTARVITIFEDGQASVTAVKATQPPKTARGATTISVIIDITNGGAQASSSSCVGRIWHKGSLEFGLAVGL